MFRQSTTMERVNRLFNISQIKTFYPEICNKQLNQIIDMIDVVGIVYYINTVLLNSFNRYAPIRTLRIIRANEPWITWTIRQMMKLKIIPRIIKVFETKSNMLLLQERELSFILSKEVLWEPNFLVQIKKCWSLYEK